MDATQKGGIVIVNVKVIDAPCGTGKTSWAIQEMSEHTERNYVYCTPFLSEIDRVRNACGLDRFTEPVGITGAKSSDFNQLLSRSECIAVTHTTFLNGTQETLDGIREGEYTLILDEVLDVVTDFNRLQTVDDAPCQSISKADFKMLEEHGLIQVQENYKVAWIGGDYDGGEFKFSEVKRLADLGRLYHVRDSLLIAVFPPEIFNEFKEIYLLTYLFDGSFLRAYFDLFGIQYEVLSVGNNSGKYKLTDYSAATDLAFRSKCKELIHVYEGKRNRGGRSLSVNWFKGASKGDYAQLRNDLHNFLIVFCGARSRDMMWTCPQDYSNRIAPRGCKQVRSLTDFERKLPERARMLIKRLTSCFVSCNARATNDFGDRWALAYCLNMYPNTMLEGFFRDSGITIDRDAYALSSLIQWIFRSRVRNGLPVVLYLPSSRMRILFNRWLDGEFA